MAITTEDLVRREVFYCVSSLVSTLASGNPYTDAKDLGILMEQAQELTWPLLDYESAAEEAGWKPAKDGWRKATSFGHLQHPGPVEELCDVEDIEPHEREVYEHWIVSEWLADKLEAQGEKVDRDFAGLTVWARTTTGQAIRLDYVIERICEEVNKAC
jgi:hypothetical protein